MLRIAITKFPEPTSYYRTTILVLVGGHARLRLGPRVPLADFRGVDRVLVARAVRTDRARPLLRHEPRLRRRGAADGRARARVDGAVPDRRHGRAPDDDRPVRAPRRDGEGPPRARDAADDRRRHLARGAGIGGVRGRVPDPRRRVPARVVVGGDRRRRDRARGDVHAARDLGRAARGARLDGRRRGARPAARRARARRAARRRAARPLRVAGGDLAPLVRGRRADAAGRRSSSSDRDAARRLVLDLDDPRAARGVVRRAARAPCSCPRRSARPFAAIVSSLGFVGGLVTSVWLYVVERRRPSRRSRLAFYRDRWTALVAGDPLRRSASRPRSSAGSTSRSGTTSTSPSSSRSCSPRPPACASSSAPRT